MPGYFDVLQESDSEKGSPPSKREVVTSSSQQQRTSIKATTHDQPTKFPNSNLKSEGEELSEASSKVFIPSYEDLSTSRADEVTVLEAVYGDDFQQDQSPEGWAILNVQVRPPDVPTKQIGSQLRLSVRLGKKYPYVVPFIVMRDVKGLSQQQQIDLMNQLQIRAKELTKSGSVMVVELVQVVEDFLAEHNRDPNLSAWEQMKAREALELAKEKSVLEEMNRLMNANMNSIVSPVASLTHRQMQSPSNASSFAGPTAAVTEVEKELIRQRDALETARRLRLQQSNTKESAALASSNHLSEEDDEEDFDFDYDTNLAPAGSSRYQSDFIELGVLGRGGGGEVVKVRNRLDRRVYAIKKIILESETGRMANFAATQNRKLIREVTTISRMTHKNIVRYYQAWVEGRDDGPVVQGATVDEDRQTTLNLESGSDASEESSQGWWTSSPKVSKDQDHVELFDDSTSNEVKSNDPLLRGIERHSGAIASLLEQENEIGFHSPLLTGLGFQNKMYDNMLDQGHRRSTDRGSESPSEHDGWDDSSVKVGPGDGKAILYIQMEYCATTLRKMIDDRLVFKLGETEVWRLVRQIVEALQYIHSRNIIHRDLKPGNVFLDAEHNIRLGDFGLATRHRRKIDTDEAVSMSNPLVNDEIDDISDLLGQAALSSTTSSPVGEGESMTGGVGTTFYRAPEQEKSSAVRGDSTSYTAKADIFSFGVILFEMFHPPFSTYMERAEVLTNLRGDKRTQKQSRVQPGDEKLGYGKGHDIQERARDRFPLSFIQNVPMNAQKIILWCLEWDAKKRPSAVELLSSEHIPRKIELEEMYLAEALEILTTSQSESYLQILNAVFSRPALGVVEMTYDTDIAAKANSLNTVGDKERPSPPEELMTAIGNIRAGAIDMSSLRSLAMSYSSLIAATSALKRAQNAGRLGRTGQGMLTRSAKRTAGILAMRSAAAAAVTGALDGVHGSDPSVVEQICDLLTNIFRQHGAVHLRSPLLRPRTGPSMVNAVGGPAEVVNSRGVALLLPEDLTASFARALGRGGAAASHLKRYDIDRVYHKSMAGGHPRETLEASFDVVFQGITHGCLLEAETILVACQVMALLPLHNAAIGTHTSRTPLWYLRLGHSRLADTVLELCGVPPKEDLRRACFHILTRFASAPPITVLDRCAHKSDVDVQQRDNKIKFEKLDNVLGEAVQHHEMPPASARKLRAFIEACYPLRSDVYDTIESLKRAFSKMRSLDEADMHPKRRKRFEEAARDLKSINELVTTLSSLQLNPPVGSQDVNHERKLCPPLYISLDLGLRQKRRHYHGGTIFQCIVLPDNFYDTAIDMDEHNEMIVSASGRGIKVAEGGNYSELVRLHRPPGNFATAFVSYYTAAPIPVASGVRFFVGKLVELVYLDAAMSGRKDVSLDSVTTNDVERQGLEVLRRSLGHPFAYSQSVQCVVVSPNGMDDSTTSERFLVASRLWMEGVSTEYLPQSSVMLSLVRRFQTETNDDSSVSDWSLEELYGVCAIMKIPFLVIVQPHLLKDKGSVRLRRVTAESLSQGSTSTGPGGGEVFVSLDSLASTIFSMAGKPDVETNDKGSNHNGPTAGIREQRLLRSTVEVDCIYIDNDVILLSDVSKYDTHAKSYLKAMKNVTKSAESYLSSLQDPSHLAGHGQPGVPVFAVTEVSFWALRDFGTALMRRERQDYSAQGAYTEILDKYPQYKRNLKALATAIDNYMKRHGFWLPPSHRGMNVNNNSKSHGLLTALLYSRIDDRFDMLTLNCGSSSSTTTSTTRSNDGMGNSSKKR